LDVDADYMRQTIDDTLVFGFLLTLATWKKLGPDRSLGSLGDDFTMQLMLAGRWEATRAYSEHAADNKLFESEASRLVLQVNRWLATKRLEGAEAIAKEVTDWDVSALGITFVIAREALLDHLDHLTGAIQAALASEDLTMNHVHTWPILAELRESPQYAVIVSKREPQLEPAPAIPTTRRPRKTARAAAKEPLQN
jgi:hypothetical protein